MTSLFVDNYEYNNATPIRKIKAQFSVFGRLFLYLWQKEKYEKCWSTRKPAINCNPYAYIAYMNCMVIHWLIASLSFFCKNVAFPLFSYFKHSLNPICSHWIRSWQLIINIISILSSFLWYWLFAYYTLNTNIWAFICYRRAIEVAENVRERAWKFPKNHWIQCKFGVPRQRMNECV